MSDSGIAQTGFEQPYEDLVAAPSTHTLSGSVGPVSVRFDSARNLMELQLNQYSRRSGFTIPSRGESVNRYVNQNRPAPMQRRFHPHGSRVGIERFQFRCLRRGAQQETRTPVAIAIKSCSRPLIDGRKVARYVKRASESTPVILLTGWGQRLIAEGEALPHIDRILSKPPRLLELREALTLCLSPGESAR